MNNKEIINIVYKQLALDYNFNENDLYNKKNIFCSNDLKEGRRIYSQNKSMLKILAVNNIAVFSADEVLLPWLKKEFTTYPGEWIFLYQEIKKIDKKLMEYNYEVYDTHHYYIPNLCAKDINPSFDVKWYDQNEILQFKGDDRFDEAFAFQETHPDVLAVAAMDGNEIMGMAGASTDSQMLWQIGINVMPEYTGKGIATGLVTLLKNAVLQKGIIPFYGTANSHNYSKRVAINAGFTPFWAELLTRKCK